MVETEMTLSLKLVQEIKLQDKLRRHHSTTTNSSRTYH